MKQIVGFAIGMASGTLLYTRFVSDALQFDWGRAIFVGVFAAFSGAIYSRVWQKKSRGH